MLANIPMACHSWSHSCVLLTRPWISKTLVDEIFLCFSDKRKFTLYRTMDIKRIF